MQKSEDNVALKCAQAFPEVPIVKHKKLKKILQKSSHSIHF